MTTITIERELLEQALAALSAPNYRVFSESSVASKLRAALAAPATAPDQPASHDAPTCEGLWSNSVNWRVHKVLEETIDAYQDTNARWFGPIPEDKP